MSNGNVSEYVSSKKGFYIGDPCYVLGDEFYHGVWCGKHNCEDGLIQNPENGFSFAVSGTAWGDGCYGGTDGHDYPVDSGTIAVVPEELIEKPDGIECGRYVEGAGEAFFSEVEGRFEITLPSGEEVTIETSDMYEDDGGEEDDGWDE